MAGLGGTHGSRTEGSREGWMRVASPPPPMYRPILTCENQCRRTAQFRGVWRTKRYHGERFRERTMPLTAGFLRAPIWRYGIGDSGPIWTHSLLFPQKQGEFHCARSFRAQIFLARQRLVASWALTCFRTTGPRGGTRDAVLQILCQINQYFTYCQEGFVMPSRTLTDPAGVR